MDMIYYHIDRDLTIKAQKTLSFEFHLSGLCSGKIFPSLSAHGVHYLVHDEKHEISRDYELVLEYVRAALFPKYPSRFVCLFAHQDKNAALSWANEYHKGKPFNLVTIESERGYTFDASWITHPSSKNRLPIPRTSYIQYIENAYSYWNGERSDAPMLETLIPLPCKIVDIKPFSP